MRTLFNEFGEKLCEIRSGGDRGLALLATSLSQPDIATARMIAKKSNGDSDAIAANLSSSQLAPVFEQWIRAHGTESAARIVRILERHKNR